MQSCDVRAEAESILLQVGPGHRAMVTTSWENGEYPLIERHQRITHGPEWYRVVVAGIYVHLAISGAEMGLIELVFHEPHLRVHSRQWSLGHDGRWGSISLS